MITVREAECHPDICLDVEGPNEHVANINPVGHTTLERWRVDCDSCATNIRADLESKSVALAVAKLHVVRSYEEYWRHRNYSEN